MNIRFSIVSSETPPVFDHKLLPYRLIKFLRENGLDVENFSMNEVVTRCKMCQAVLQDNDQRFAIHEGVACTYCYTEDKLDDKGADLEKGHDEAWAYDAIPR